MIAAATITLAQPATAKGEARTFAVHNDEVGVLVFPNDVTDRSYKLLGEETAGVRTRRLSRLARRLGDR